jgi:Ni,Fe-hydrogenase I cytochrome b subunit
VCLKKEKSNFSHFSKKFVKIRSLVPGKKTFERL